MPRDGSGTYTLPAGNPVVAGTVIEVDWANPTMSDLGASMTDSLSRTGSGGMLARLIHVDGALSLPSITFTSDTQAGFFLNSVGDMQAVVALTPVMRWRSVGADVWDAGGAVWRRVLTEGLSTADDITLDDAGLPITATTVQEGFDETFVYLAGTPTFGNVTVGSLVAQTGIAVTGISILENVTVSGTLDVTGAVTMADLDVSNDVEIDGTLRIANVPGARTSSISAFEGATREGMGIYGNSSTANGAWISIYGDADVAESNTLRMGYGGTASAAIEINPSFTSLTQGSNLIFMFGSNTTFNSPVDFGEDVSITADLILRDGTDTSSIDVVAGSPHTLRIHANTSQVDGAWIEMTADEGGTPGQINMGTSGTQQIFQVNDDGLQIIGDVVLGGDFTSGNPTKTFTVDGASVLADITTEVITFDNAAAPANVSNIRNVQTAGRQELGFYGFSDLVNGGWMVLYGGLDGVATNQARIGAGGVTGITVSSSGVDIPNLTTGGITFEASGDTARMDIAAGAPHALRIFAATGQTDGAWIDMSADEGGTPGRLIMGASTTANRFIVGQSAVEVNGDFIVNGGFTASGSSTVNDNGGTPRTAASVPAKIDAVASRAFNESDIGHLVTYASGITLTINSSLGYDGCEMRILGGSGAGCTIAEGGGVTLNWRQGGSNSAGNRTIAAFSVVQLTRTSSTSWTITGDGIS